MVSNSSYDKSVHSKWARESFPWSSEVRSVNSKIFGHKSFRENQLEIINASMSGRDVFVLMPTGGGKSLCFQVNCHTKKIIATNQAKLDTSCLPTWNSFGGVSFDLSHTRPSDAIDHVWCSCYFSFIYTGSRGRIECYQRFVMDIPSVPMNDCALNRDEKE
jgi:hypothetical protein